MSLPSRSAALRRLEQATQGIRAKGSLELAENNSVRWSPDCGSCSQLVVAEVVDGADQTSSWEKQKESWEAITKVVVEPPDLVGVFSQLSAVEAKLDSMSAHLQHLEHVVSEGCREAESRHTDVLTSISGTSSVQALTRLERRLQVLEEGGAEQRQALERDAKAARAGREDLREHVSSACEVLRKELNEQVAALRDDFGRRSTLIQEELQKQQSAKGALTQTLADAARSGAAGELRKGCAELLEAVREGQEVSASRSSAEVVRAELLRAIREVPDAVGERIRGTQLADDQAEVLQVLKTLEQQLDARAFARTVEDQLALVREHQRGERAEMLSAIENMAWKADNTDVLEAVERIREPDLTGLLTTVHSAVKSIEVDLSPILSAMRRLTMKVDHTEVLQAIRSIIPGPDLQQIATAVEDALRRAGPRREPELCAALGVIGSTVEGLGPLRAELGGLRAEVLAAISELKSCSQPKSPRIPVKVESIQRPVLQPCQWHVARPVVMIPQQAHPVRLQPFFAAWRCCASRPQPGAQGRHSPAPAASEALTGRPPGRCAAAARPPEEGGLSPRASPRGGGAPPTPRTPLASPGGVCPLARRPAGGGGGCAPAATPSPQVPRHFDFSAQQEV